MATLLLKLLLVSATIKIYIFYSLPIFYSYPIFYVSDMFCENLGTSEFLIFTTSHFTHYFTLLAHTETKATTTTTTNFIKYTNTCTIIRQQNNSSTTLVKQ